MPSVTCEGTEPMLKQKHWRHENRLVSSYGTSYLWEFFILGSSYNIETRKPIYRDLRWRKEALTA
jgi:hypothetical protein